MIQVRNVPEKLHRELVRRASARGQTLTDYIQELLEREVSTSTIEEVIARIKSHEPVDLGVSGAELVRAAREDRERELDEREQRRWSKRPAS